MAVDLVFRKVSSPGSPPSGRMLIGQIAKYVPGSIVPAVIGVISAATFTRYLTSSEYGVYSLWFSVIGVVAAVLSQWLVQGSNRFLPAAVESGDSVVTEKAIVTSIVLILIISVSAAPFAITALYIINGGALNAVIVPAMVLSVATALYRSISAVLQAKMMAGAYSRIYMTEVLLRYSLSLGLAVYLAANAASLLWGAGIAILLLLPVMWKQSGLPTVSLADLTTEIVWTKVAELWRYGAPMIGWFVSASLLNVSDRYLLHMLRGPEDVGVYSANYNLVAGAVQLMVAPITLATHSFLMRAWGSGDRERAGAWLSVIGRLFLYGSVILVGVMIVLAEDLVKLLLGPEFYDGYRIIPLVVGGMILWQFGMYTHKPLEFTGQTLPMFGYCGASVVLNMLINLILIPRYGIMGAACTAVVSFGSYAIATAVHGRSVLSWRVLDIRDIGVLSVPIGLFLACAWIKARFVDAIGYGPTILIMVMAAVLISGCVAGAAYYMVKPHLQRLPRVSVVG